MIGKVKPKLVLVGPCIGEMYWEFGRFAPYVIWKREKEYKSSNIKFIVLTRETMFDLYAGCASIFIPLSIPGDGTLYKPNCFRLDEFPNDAYNFIIKTFYNLSNSFSTSFPSFLSRSISASCLSLDEPAIITFLTNLSRLPPGIF